MKNFYKTGIGAVCALILASCAGSPKLNVNVSDKYEGQNVEIITLLDSVVLASSPVVDGKVSLEPTGSEPVFATLLIDGRVRGYYITEPGEAQFDDNTQTAVGTPLNDLFGSLLAQLDSIEQIDDMDLYLNFVEEKYNENKNNPIGSYFGIEWLKYAEPNRVDSMLADAPADLSQSSKAAYYKDFAKLRAATAAGQPYTDFEGEDENGNPVNLSAYVVPGKYTVIDFWASWCPYCIKELPQLASFYDKWKDNGVEIVGVAVRNAPEDTKAAVNKHSITWPVIYNTQRKPYNIYGFSGIPHHILIGPDGTIISRGENIGQIEERIAAAKEAESRNN